MWDAVKGSGLLFLLDFFFNKLAQEITSQIAEDATMHCSCSLSTGTQLLGLLCLASNQNMAVVPD